MEQAKLIIVFVCVVVALYCTFA